GDLRAGWAMDKQFLVPEMLGKLPSELNSLQSFQSKKGRGLIAKGKGQIISIHYMNQKLVTSTEQMTMSGELNLYVGKFQYSNQDDILFVSNKEQNVSIMYQMDNSFTKPYPIKGIRINSDKQLLVGDWNGDGRSDLIVYSAETGVWREYENEGNGKFHPLDNDFGPWAQGTGRMGFVADFDGNGKTDIGSYDKTKHNLDIALSFRGDTP
ncbi:MAG TPA: VCBS repeat-containing protein, partial [Pseudoneobacillus sp.]|nr:VCBS repeat-containing protein [Pseudoneobacillus sp.]